MKVLLILVDGMRPDALPAVPKAQEFIRKGASCLNATSVLPSVTLPCHVTLFHSVDPSRHGTTTNTYMPQVRPIQGLCEVLNAQKKTCAMFYNWEPLRDLSRPRSLTYSYFVRGTMEENPAGAVVTFRQADNMVADEAIDYLTTRGPDFAFLYMGFLDEAGHKYGWMTDGYYDALANSWRNIDRVVEAVGEEYTVIIVADHGGHDRTHGFDLPEDMTIPVIALGDAFQPGTQLENLNLKDIAPTICTLMGVEPDSEWEGKSFV